MMSSDRVLEFQAEQPGRGKPGTIAREFRLGRKMPPARITAMSIRSMVTDFLDKVVDARFKRDTHDRLLFFPWGFGSGRIVPDAAVEARLRRAYRWLMIAMFCVLIPVISALNGFYELTGFAFLVFLAACTAGGFASQLYLVWLSRDLPRSDERMSYSSAMVQSLDRFGRKFLIFGLVVSVIFTATGAFMLVFPPTGVPADPIGMAACVLVFAPMVALYAYALRRRRNGGGGAAA
jgi:hypothetical protein